MEQKIIRITLKDFFDLFLDGVNQRNSMSYVGGKQSITILKFQQPNIYSVLTNKHGKLLSTSQGKIHALTTARPDGLKLNQQPCLHSKMVKEQDLRGKS